MNKYRDKFRHFARGRHRRGKFMRLAMIALPILLLFSMCSAFMGHGRHHHGRHGRHGEVHAAYHAEKDGKGFHRRGGQDASPAASANAPVSTPQANAQSEDQALDELKIIQEALERAVVREDIKPDQYNSIMAQETVLFTAKKEQGQENEAAAAAASSNSSNETASQAEARSERRNHRRDRGGSPIGFLLGGLFKLGLLALLLSFIARRFGFRPWRRPLGFRRWQQAYADAWGAPASAETPVPPEDEEFDDIDRELAREEQKQQAQQAQQNKAEADKAAKSEDAADNSKNNDQSKPADKPEDKNAA